MNPDESIPDDASTAHRSDTSLPPENTEDATQISPLYAAQPIVELDGLEEAKTVIRDDSGRRDSGTGGSSRAQRASDNWNALDRTPVAITQILLGKQLNHFLLQELIGGGGMGAVFRAHDAQLDREVAIKVIPFAGEDADLQRRFRNEAQSAAKLDHPRIARVFEVGNQDDWYYIVFEYIKGTNIRDLVYQSDVLTIDDAVYYTCQVAEALQHASDRGIVHRDVKPSNVLIDSNREVKLVDMGLARSDKMEMSQEDLTASGVTLGTFDYISPEQAKDPRAADLRSDIYSLGCTLYFMLTGQPPYPGGTMLQKLLSHGNAPPPDARQHRSGVSHELSAVIQNMLAKDPDQRYQTANDLIADLRAIAIREDLSRSQGVAPAPVGVSSPVMNWLEYNSPWLVAVSLLLLGAAWLQLSSAASRDEFKLTPSASAQRTSEDSNNARLPGDSRANLPEAAADPSLSRTVVNAGETDNSQGVDIPVSQPSDPPSLTNVPVPSELDSSMGDPTASATASPDVTTGLDSTDDLRETTDPESPEPRWAMTEKPRVIRVLNNAANFDTSGTPLLSDKDGAAITDNLTNALKLADEYKIDRIELATSVLYSDPVVIRRDGMTIASTVGGTAIVFRTPPTLGLERTEMIGLGANKIDFDDLHFVWDVPASQIADGALISLSANRLLRLTDCSITIGNATESSEVHAFSVNTNADQSDTQQDGVQQTLSETDQSNGDEASRSSSLPLVGIQMYNVIVRGQIGLIKLQSAAALQLQWENGLLAISGRMIETNGTAQQASLLSSPIQLSLRQLTSHTPAGVLEMNLRSGGRYPIMIDRDVSNCVFVVDRGAPHFRITGLDSLDGQSDILESRGQANAYEVDRAMLLLEDQDGNQQTVSMRDLAAGSYSWWKESSTRWTIWWKQETVSDASEQTTDLLTIMDIPPDQRTPQDYRQDGAVFGGFDEKLLPQLPFESETTGLDISPDRSQLGGKR